MNPMKTTQWHGCYDLRWKGVITDEAHAHPAKFSRALIERIYDHCLEQDYINPGELVGDPFGGVGLGGLTAAYRGLRWVGCELEPRFVAMAEGNFRLHAGKWATLGKPHPLILQGDSRRFHELVAQVSAVLGSPPFGDNPACPPVQRDRLRTTSDPKQHGSAGPQYISPDSPGQIGVLPLGTLDATISSPPFTQTKGGAKGINVKGYGPDGKDKVGARTYQGTGGDRAEGNIENLPAGNLDAAISSPPWEQNCEGSMAAAKWKDPEATARMWAENTRPGCHPQSYESTLRKMHKDNERRAYGSTPGQIGQLQGGSVDACVSSPPYAANEKHDYLMSEDGRTRARDVKRGFKQGHGSFRGSESYGDAPGQIGRETEETYWTACSLVYQSVRLALKPGGVLVLVLKDYVKSGKRVPLSDDTVRLCESLGFQLIERVQAMLVSETRHADMFAETGESVKTKSRKSFFRRLAESKGSPKIDYEDVLFFRNVLP